MAAMPSWPIQIVEGMHLKLRLAWRQAIAQMLVRLGEHDHVTATTLEYLEQRPHGRV